MRRSKLEMYVDVLKVLAHKGPLKLTHIMYKANVNCSVLKQHIGFLTRQNLVEEQAAGKKSARTRVVYAITERGRTVLKYFRNLNAALQITEEANKIPALLCWATSLWSFHWRCTLQHYFIRAEWQPPNKGKEKSTSANCRGWLRTNPTILPVLHFEIQKTFPWVNTQWRKGKLEARCTYAMHASKPVARSIHHVDDICLVARNITFFLGSFQGC